jgi:hypothetical protein
LIFIHNRDIFVRGNEVDSKSNSGQKKMPDRLFSDCRPAGENKATFPVTPFHYHSAAKVVDW